MVRRDLRGLTKNTDMRLGSRLLGIRGCSVMLGPCILLCSGVGLGDMVLYSSLYINSWSHASSQQRKNMTMSFLVVKDMGITSIA